MTDKEAEDITQVVEDKTRRTIVEVVAYTATVYAMTDRALSYPDQSRLTRCVIEGVRRAMEGAIQSADTVDGIYAREGEEGLKRDIARSLAIRAANEARN